MKGTWLVSQWKSCTCLKSETYITADQMVFPGIAIDANKETTAIMTWIMIDNTSKASCGLNRNPALRIDKYPLCPVYSNRFQTQVRIQILHLSFMNYLSHHVLPCQQIIFWMSFSNFRMLHSIPLFLKLLTYLVGFELTISDLLLVDFNTLPLCHGRLGTWVVICIFIFKFGLKFLNSEYHRL